MEVVLWRMCHPRRRGTVALNVQAQSDGLYQAWVTQRGAVMQVARGEARAELPDMDSVVEWADRFKQTLVARGWTDVPEIAEVYARAKQRMESEALALRERQPSMHLADACAEVLRTDRKLWDTYRAAMHAGLPSEFQRERRRHDPPTPRERAWRTIEDLARTLVAASTEPLTLRQAVGRIVEVNPDLYRQYQNAGRR